MDRAVAASGNNYNVYPPYTNALRAMGKIEAAKQLADKLIAALEQRLEIAPEDTRARGLLAVDSARAGKNREVVAETEKAVAMRPWDSRTLYNAACTYGVLNMKQEALATFRWSIEAGYRNRDWAARDKDLACLHDDPEFQRLIKDHSAKELGAIFIASAAASTWLEARHKIRVQRPMSSRTDPARPFRITASSKNSGAVAWVSSIKRKTPACGRMVALKFLPEDMARDRGGTGTLSARGPSRFGSESSQYLHDSRYRRRKWPGATSSWSCWKGRRSNIR